MNFRSFGDLGNDIAASVAKIPREVELIVGVPRSGLMAASMLALMLNRKFCDLGSFIENRPLRSGLSRRAADDNLIWPHAAKNVLVLDDSVDSGAAMQCVREELRPLAKDRQLRTAAVYATQRGIPQVDLHFVQLEMPRVFAWNLFHRRELADYCVDIDGVLCRDPLQADNDDGARYLKFLSTAEPLTRPSYEIGHLVTSRLEKYREPTLRWLGVQGIAFKQLHMLDLPSAEERRRRGCHASFKAEVYRSLTGTSLFIESEPAQAIEIARLSGKAVLDFANQAIVPRQWNTAYLTARSTTLTQRIVRRVQRALG
jgi:uncharacterized HAD superfamily protein/hypoxanthine-guanine phosphoribosyltransferase